MVIPKIIHSLIVFLFSRMCDFFRPCPLIRFKAPCPSSQMVSCTYRISFWMKWNRMFPLWSGPCYRISVSIQRIMSIYKYPIIIHDCRAQPRSSPSCRWSRDVVGYQEQLDEKIFNTVIVKARAIHWSEFWDHERVGKSFMKYFFSPKRYHTATF